MNNKYKPVDESISNAVKWSIVEYSLFVTRIVKKGLSLYNDNCLGKEWFSGIYMDNHGEVQFTEPFTMENRPKSYYDILGAVGSFKLNDSEEYYIIPETNNKFVEVLDDKGEIDPDFPLKDYSLLSDQNSHISKSFRKVSIKKYDDAVSKFIKTEIQKGSFLDLFELYLEKKIEILNKTD